MLCIINHNTNPYFNIASEEYLLKYFTDDIFMLYRNEPSVIIGKHQNIYAEINYWHVKENGIKVVRRLSGGGTVYHDLGNVNFLFVQNGEEGKLVDFKRFTEPILQALIGLGIPAARSNRNDLLINGLKISGNAEHIYKKRVLHHGTLLFSASLADLHDALQINRDIYSDRAVKSIRSSVTNISEFVNKNITVSDFTGIIQNAIKENLNNVRNYEFSDADKSAINKLVNDKYGTWEWNYRYSPRFEVLRSGKINEQEIEVKLEVESGTIKYIAINGEFKNKLLLTRALVNAKYNEDEIRVILNSIVVSDKDATALLRLLF